MCSHTDQSNAQQIVHRFRYFSKTVKQLILHIIPLFQVLNAGNSLVNIQLLGLIHNISAGNKSIHIKIYHSSEICNRRNALQILHCFVQHLAIHVITYSFHMTMLPHTQQIARTTDFQISHGNLKATSQIRKFLDCRQTFFCNLFQHLIPLIHQERIGSPVGTSHTTAQLIKLGETEIVGIVNNHSIYIGNIQSCLNNRGRHQHIDFSLDKIEHDPLQFVFLHLSMSKCHICLRHQLGDLGSNIPDIIDTIINIINLSASCHLTYNCLADHLFIIFAHKSLNGQTIVGSFLQHTHITDSNETHVQSTRNGSCCQCQHIHIFLQFLDFFLMSHTKTLFLINNQQT